MNKASLLYLFAAASFAAAMHPAAHAQDQATMSGAMNDVIKDFDVKEDDGSPGSLCS
jgi:hypothetical protein